MAGRPPAPIPGQPPSLPSRRPPPRPPSPDAGGSDDEYYSEFHGEADIEDSTPAPPPPPSRRPGPPPPPVTEEYYSEFHGEADIQEPPPPPPPSSRRPGLPPPPGEEIYDDFDLEDGQNQQDVYEATDDVSPPPPLPGNRPAPRLPTSSAPPPLPSGGDDAEEVYADPDEVSQPEVYEAVNESDHPSIPAAPAPPPVPPNRNRRDPPPKPDVPASRPEPKAAPPPPMGGLVIDANSLQSKLGNLRKTSASAKAEEKSSPGSGKVYADKSTFQDKKNLFERRSSTVSAEDVGPKSPPASKSPVDSKSPHIVTLSKPSLPSRPNVPSTLPPPKPPLSRPGPRSPDSSGESLKSPISPKPPESPPADDGDGDELYDDGSSFQILDPLVGNSWYFPRVDRKESEKKLNKFIQEDGMFLLRKSTKDPKKPYTLDVVYEKRIYHLQVRLRSDKNYALGSEKDDEMYFRTVKELVDHHKRKEVILIGEHPGKVLLQRSP